MPTREKLNSPNAGKKLKGQWSLKYDCCVHCGRTDRRHEARGYCLICYSYKSNPEKHKAKRKQYEVRKDTVAKNYARVRAWHVANAKKIKAYKQEWHKAKGPKPKWPVGKVVWVRFAGFWCQGTIIETQGKRVVIRLLGGTVVNSAGRWIKAEQPYLVKELA